MNNLISSFIGTCIGCIIVHMMFGIDIQMIDFMICWILSAIVNALREKQTSD